MQTPNIHDLYQLIFVKILHYSRETKIYYEINEETLKASLNKNNSQKVAFLHSITNCLEGATISDQGGMS